MWHSARITGTAPSQPCPAGRDALAPRVSRRRPARAEEEEEAVSTTAASPPPPPRCSVHHAGTTTAAASLPRAGRRLPKPASPRVPPPRPATGRPGSAPQGLTGPPPPPSPTRRTHLRCRPRPRPRRISRPWRCPPHRPARLPPRRGSGPALASPGRTPPRSAPPRPAPLRFTDGRRLPPPRARPRAGGDAGPGPAGWGGPPRGAIDPPGEWGPRGRTRPLRRARWPSRWWLTPRTGPTHPWRQPCTLLFSRLPPRGFGEKACPWLRGAAAAGSLPSAPWRPW